jgi:uncharacterized protein
MQFFLKIGQRRMGPFSPEQILQFSKDKKISPTTRIATSADGPFEPMAKVWDSIHSNIQSTSDPTPSKQSSIPPLPGSPRIEPERFAAVPQPAPLNPAAPEIIQPHSTQAPTFQSGHTASNQKQTAILIAVGCIVSLLFVGVCFIGIRLLNQTAPVSEQASQPETPSKTEQDDAPLDSTDAEVQLALGLMHARGDGVARNYAKALKCFEAAAEQKLAAAQLNIGIMYSNGYGVTKDKSQALKWYQLAADQGNADAQVNAGFLYYSGDGIPMDIEKAVRWFRRAAEQQDPNAQFFLGKCYDNGYGVTSDKVEAANWYRLAGAQGHVDAQINLGLMHDLGDGIPENGAEAVKWYRKAAEQKKASAQYFLGLCYDEGNGVTEDNVEAVRWFRLAAEQDHVSSQVNLGLMYELGEGVVEDNTEAVKWYRRAAEQQDADAQYYLGVCYNLGNGIAKDKFEAVKWLEASVANEPSLQNSAWVLLGEIKAELGDASLSKAIDSYDEGQRCDDRGDYEEAIEAYKVAIAADPQFPWGYNNRAYLLVSCPDPKFHDHVRALEFAKIAAEITKYRDWRILDTLAAAHASAGDFDKATEIALTVLDMAPNSVQAKCQFYVNRYRARLRWAPYQSPDVD